MDLSCFPGVAAAADVPVKTTKQQQRSTDRTAFPGLKACLIHFYATRTYLRIYASAMMHQVTYACTWQMLPSFYSKICIAMLDRLSVQTDSAEVGGPGHGAAGDGSGAGVF